MMIRTLATLAALLLPLYSVGGQSPAPAATIKPADTVQVALTTTMGVIIVEVDRGRAPVSAANFLRYVDQKRFDGITFYRTMKLGTDAKGNPEGLIQAGTKNDPKRVLKPIAHEPTDKTGLKHVAGALSMARWAPGTATGDFSILLSTMPGLDANPGGPGDNAGYAVFGRVVEGMDVVKKIHFAPTSATLGEGVMRGQMIAAPVRIITARRSTKSVATPKPPAVTPTAPTPAASQLF